MMSGGSKPVTLGQSAISTESTAKFSSSISFQKKPSAGRLNSRLAAGGEISLGESSATKNIAS
jgi:hypothetical protein